MSIKHILFTVISLVALTFLISCESNLPVPIKLVPSSATVKVGHSITLELKDFVKEEKIIDWRAVPSKLTPGEVTLLPNEIKCEVTGVKAGLLEVRASVGNITSNACQITVVE